MNMQHTLVGLLVTILLVTSSYGQTFNENGTNATAASITPSSINTTSNSVITTSTVIPITTTQVTSNTAITTESVTATITTTTKATNPTTGLSTTLPVTTANATTSQTSTRTTTAKAPGRKFDGLSFIGGMILVTGLGAIIYLVISYLRRNPSLPYSNLR